MPKISTKNGEQDVEIQKTSDRVEALEGKFNAFVNNDFQHLRGIVFWILKTVIIGFLLTITTIIASKYL